MEDTTSLGGRSTSADAVSNASTAIPSESDASPTDGCEVSGVERNEQVEGSEHELRGYSGQEKAGSRFSGQLSARATPQDLTEATPQDQRGGTSQDQRGGTPHNQRGATPQVQRGATPQDQRDGTPQDQRGATPQDQRATPQDQRGATPQDQRGATPQDQRGATPQDQRGATPQDQRGATPQDQRGATPQDQRGATPQDQRGGTPQDQRGATPQDQRGTTPQHQRGATPQDQRGATPQDQRGGTPQDQRGGTPQDQRGATPQDQRATPQDQRGATPQDQRGATPQDQTTGGDDTTGRKSASADVKPEDRPSTQRSFIDVDWNIQSQQDELIQDVVSGKQSPEESLSISRQSQFEDAVSENNEVQDIDVRSADGTSLNTTESQRPTSTGSVIGCCCDQSAEPAKDETDAENPKVEIVATPTVSGTSESIASLERGSDSRATNQTEPNLEEVGDSLCSTQSKYEELGQEREVLEQCCQQESVEEGLNVQRPEGENQLKAEITTLQTRLETLIKDNNEKGMRIVALESNLLEMTAKLVNVEKKCLPLEASPSRRESSKSRTCAIL